MFRILTAAILIGVCAHAPAHAQRVVDAIVATVDTEPILRSDLIRQAAPLVGSDVAAGEALDGALVDEVLDQAIEQRILYRQAVLQGLDVPEDVLESRIQSFRDNFESGEEFRRAVEDSGATMSEFREQIRKQLLAIAMASRKRNEFSEEAVISEAELRQYYQDNRDAFGQPARVQLRRIFLSAGSDPAERARAQARLEALRDEVQTGADFAALAGQHSEGPDADTGGLVGWVQRGDLVPALEEATFALSEGELSEVVETQFGYHLLLAEQVREPGTASFDDLRTEIEPMLREEYAAERYANWIQELRKRSRVRIFL